MPAWATRMRSVIEKPSSPKMPIPNVVVQTIVRATMNAAAAQKTGPQRAASHSSSGNIKAIATTVAQGSRGKEITSPLTALTIMSATTPSMIALRAGGSRVAEPIPINSGATVMMPSASDVNQ